MKGLVGSSGSTPFRNGDLGESMAIREELGSEAGSCLFLGLDPLKTQREAREDGGRIIVFYTSLRHLSAFV